MAETTSTWDPGQYERFRQERAQPFYDLAAMVEREPAMRVVDLGCGTGQLTSWLHTKLSAASTLGVDASDTMLEQAMPLAEGTLNFEQRDITSFVADEPYDLVFSNAALQWIEGHEALLTNIAAAVAPGGQLAVQVPYNDDHASHRVARALAGGRFSEALDGYERVFPVLTPERYAELLYELGFERQHVRMQVYTHMLPETRAVIEWVKGSLMTPYRERMSVDQYEELLAQYETDLVAVLGEHSPFLYPFKRILFWGRKAA
jgi:trans-aconitate 2-methyltransferase